jgi:hypothetical protein
MQNIIQIHPSGLTKPGEVGDFFALVSIKSPNFGQKSKFQSPCQYFFSPIIILFLQYSHVPEM